jgi:hypothetical protein
MPTQPRWPLFAALRHRLTPLAPALLAIAGVFALLTVFWQVVALGVDAGQARQRASAEHDDAAWRCNALRSTAQHAGCRAPQGATAR